MKAKILHHIGVPCIAKIREIDETLCQEDDLYYLNPNAIVRFEPGGAVITPPMFYAPFVYVDRDLASLLRHRVFSVSNFPRETFFLLRDNKVISNIPPSEIVYREKYVEISGLPSQALLEVTSACNCNCLACYHALDLYGYVPPIEDILRRLDKLEYLGIGLIEVTGGEAFLRKDLAEILEYIAQLKIHFYVTTNGEYLSKIDAFLIAALKKSLGIAVSLDGVGKIHDRMRRRKGLYERMIAGMDLIHSYGIPIYLIATMNSENISCAAEMVEVAKRYNTTVHFRPTIMTGGAIVNSLESRGLAHKLRGLLRHPNVRNGFMAVQKIVSPAKYYGCGIRKKISVSSAGMLFPCVMNRGRSFSDIKIYTQRMLADQLTAETNLMLADHVRCASCKFNSGDSGSQCGGFCRFSRSYAKGLGT